MVPLLMALMAGTNDHAHIFLMWIRLSVIWMSLQLLLAVTKASKKDLLVNTQPTKPQNSLKTTSLEGAQRDSLQKLAKAFGVANAEAVAKDNKLNRAFGRNY